MKFEHFVIRPFLPWLLLLERRLTWRFCALLICESLVLVCAIVWLFLSEGSAWDSFLYYMWLALTVPLLALQLIGRLAPKWGESPSFKYLAVFGVVMAWFAGMSGRAMVKDLFHVAPGELPSAMAAATFFAMADWLVMAGVVGCFVLEIGMIVAGSRSGHRLGNRRYASPMLRQATVALVLLASLLTVMSLAKVMPQEVKRVIVARIAWDIDLLPAPAACLPKDTKAPAAAWRVLPRPAGASDTLLVQGRPELPEKPFWRMHVDEQALYSAFNVSQIECGVKNAPVDALALTERRLAAEEAHRLANAHFWGIAPIAWVVVRP
ncbi:MAG: hypothetical protein LWW83_03965 [Azonexaceae bacterium]|nr:hypothetical protein [Azonexaceae bacterium]